MTGPTAATRLSLPQGIVATRCLTTLPALERDLHAGLLAEWTQLVQLDPMASCFQTPGWCLPWYRAYHDEYDPFVVVVSSGGRLAGLVPLAVHRASGAVSFASGTMADYRDIVARPECRAAVVAELLRVYRGAGFPNPLQIGWLDPASDTARLVAAACRQQGLRFSSWQQPCYRWSPVAGENLTKKFSRVRTHLNHLKRRGEVRFDVITAADDWRAFRDAFFQQHSLRQLQADRQVSFDDPRKQRFYDRLFDGASPRTHVTALRVDGELVSGHVGLIWRDVLMLGAPSIALEHEQRSPALILLAWVMQQAQALELRGFDLTVGDTEFKRRLGNSCVRVTMIEVYARRRDYYARDLRSRAVAIAKGVVAAAAGADAWKVRVKPALDESARRLADVRATGWRALRQARQSPGTLTEEIVALPPDQGVPRVIDVHDGLWRQNHVTDLLLADPADALRARSIRHAARSYSRQRAAGATLHTLLSGKELVAWCFAQPPDDRGAVVITGLAATTPRCERTLLARVANLAAASGAHALRIRRD